MPAPVAPVQDNVFDVVCIGSGPGGEGAAMQAAKAGRRVALVERLPLIGGACTHSGTIPSKALRFAIYQATEAVKSKLFRDAGLQRSFGFGDLRRSAESVVSQQVEVRRAHYTRNDIPVFRGQARLLDPTTVEVTEDSGARRRLQTTHLNA